MTQPEPPGAPAGSTAGSTAPVEPESQTEPAPSGPPWQRLDPRMLAVTPLRQLVGFLPVIAVVLVSGAGSDLDGRFYGVLVGVVVVVAAGVARWFTTRYRVTDERVELRSGLLFRSARSVPRDRIRSVDLTAGPVHRLFRLSVLKVGTGEQSEGTDSRELALDAVSSAEADRLRQRFLERVPIAGAPASAPEAGVDVTAPASEPIARLDWSWLRYAPLTVSSLVAVGGVVGAVFQVGGELGVNPTDLGQVDAARDRFESAPLWAGITVFAVGVLVIALLGSLLIFIEAWWRFGLVREPGGTLRVRRGLLTSRSVSLEERRLRGVEVAEPLLLRAGRGARTSAVATGLGSGGRGTLLPPAPRHVAHRVGGLVLRERTPPTVATLRRHPVAALRRRLSRALLPPVVIAVVLWLTPAPTWTLAAPAVLLPLAVAVAVDAYRNLGHALTDQYLITRHGSLIRHTVALQRTGVIGWTVSQTFFQRRAGLVTLTASTAAGGGAYQVLDVGAADGIALAHRLVRLRRS